ncbi:MAG TPA: hypothetical protein PLS90_05900 [Candidatus Sumerlaeota bacterium]|nr:hypothetical protein [Candidatus Sumerlaeota bacterium]
MRSFTILVCLLLVVTRPVNAVGESVTAELNGLQLAFDADSGALIEMTYPGVGAMIQTSAARGSLLDLAYPIPSFEPLRLAARFSTGASIERTSDSVTVRWERLGPSRRRTPQSPVREAIALRYDAENDRQEWVTLAEDPFELQGNVAASVTFRALPDGRSLSMTGTVDNQSATTIPQVLFPDFMGITEFAGQGRTHFRTAGFVNNPFELLRTPARGIDFYGQDLARTGIEYASGPYYPSTPMLARWMDVGGLQGGFSLFRKWWLWGPGDNWQDSPEKVWLHLTEGEDKLRLACLHKVEIGPGERWHSDEYVLTPHRHGWAKGIEPFREYVHANLKRPYPVPRHVREGLGFRTLWMTQAYPNDPDGDIIYRAEDLPRVARECLEHGIQEICLWSWWGGMQVPISDPFPQIGTVEQLRRAIEECRELGVNVSLFISIMLVANPTAERWGLQVGPPGSGWTYHTEFVPVMRPYYGHGLSCIEAGIDNLTWRQGAYESCRRIIETLTPSLGWDQWDLYSRFDQPNQPRKQPFYELTQRIRAAAHAQDPEATFHGECIENLDANAIYLDYSWNWVNWPWMEGGDCRPFNSVYPAPRLNVNIDRSAREVRGAFIDNHYLNVFTSRVGGINGSGRIADYPELSRALKQCAGLRRQFLPYFVDGTLIGDCILTEEPAGARLSAYVLPDRLLVLALNDSETGQRIPLAADLTPWLRSPTGQYEVRRFDLEGRLLASEINGSRWRPTLGDAEMVVYEILARPD